MKIKPAERPNEIEAVGRLFRDYERSLGEDLSFQGFEEELAGLPGKYAPPEGALLIAVDGVDVAGCVGVRKLQEGVCEMKRLYVKPEFRGAGLGRELALVAIQAGRDGGSSIMRLDTLERLAEAMELYESLGFRRTRPYYENPLPGVVYWEMDL